MHPISRRTTLAALLAACSSVSWAADYPDRPLKLILGFAPGGTMDILARMVAVKLSTSLGQPVVVDNRTGANGSLAALAVKGLPSDGYTLHMTTSSTQTLYPLVQKGLTYDPDRDFTPLVTVARAPLVLVVSSDVPANTLPELLAYIKTIGTPSYGSAGAGQTMHVAGLMLQEAAGVQMVHVPFKGEVPALTEVMANRVTGMFGTVSGVIPHLKGGKLKAIAVADSVRSPSLPNVPTAAEQGVPSLQLAVSYLMMVKSGVPSPITKRLETELLSVIGDPSFSSKIAALGIAPQSANASQTAAMLQPDAGRYSPLVSKYKISLD